MNDSAGADALLNDLNDPQREAVTHRDGPLLVLAGPGSGKTRVITRRAAFLVENGVRPSSILAITFTNKAADEMKRRIVGLGVGQGMWVYTFHALGVRLLREFGPLARVQPGFSIYDEGDRAKVVREAMEIAKVGEKQIRPDDLQYAISRAKNRLQTVAEFELHSEHMDQQVIARVYEIYEQLLEQRNAVDFDDLLMRTALVLEQQPDITERLNQRFRYLLIDEYQDTNHAQYLIARKLSQHHRNICATGDPDQSIYAWRGANIRNIMEFERDYADARVVRLEQNYRSVGSVLRAADRLIQKNEERKHKALWTENPAGDPVDVWQFARGDQEAEQIAEQIREMHAGGRDWSEFAIFYRVNAISRGLEDALRRRGIPYKIARGVEFYNRKEIKDLVAYLRLLINPADSVALVRVINTPARGIGKKTIERLVAEAVATRRPVWEILSAAGSIPALKSAAGRLGEFADLIETLRARGDAGVSAIVSEVLQRSGMEAVLREEKELGGEDRLANVQEFVTAAVAYERETEEPSLAEFLQRVALVSDQDAVDEQAGVVMLMTLHAAKGLEFPVVFVVGLEQGLLPHERALKFMSDRNEIEEERRLCFVGITRARERLILTQARERLIRGQVMPRAMSQFLIEIDDGDLAWREFRDPGLPRPGRPRADGFVPMDEFSSSGDAEGGPRRAPSRSSAIRRRAVEQGDSDISFDVESFGRRGGKQRGGLDGDSDDVPVIIRDEDGEIEEVGRRRGKEASPFADWATGTLVSHKAYGVGRIVWIRPGGSVTRASIRFADYGEKTFILELAPVTKVEE